MLKVGMHIFSVEFINIPLCRKQQQQKFWEASFCQRGELHLFIYFCEWKELETEGNKKCSVERDDLHVLDWSVHSYIN